MSQSMMTRTPISQSMMAGASMSQKYDEGYLHTIYGSSGVYLSFFPLIFLIVKHTLQNIILPKIYTLISPL